MAADRRMSIPKIASPASDRLGARVLVAIFLLSLALRLLFVWVQETYHIFDIYFFAGDSVLYEGLARSLLAGEGYSFKGHPTAVVTPGYPFFLAAVHMLGADSPMSVGIVQCVVGAITCLLIAVIGNAVGGRLAGLTAGVLAATYVHFVWWTGYILTETLFVFFVVSAVVTLLQWQEDVSSIPRAFAAGLLLGLGALTRPHMVGFGVLACILIVVSARGQRRRAAASAACLVLALALVLTPWAIRNYVVFGVPIVGSTLSGAVLYQGNSPGATGGTDGYLDARDFRPLNVPPTLGEVETDRAYSRAAWQFIRDEPWSLPGLAVRKFVNMWRPTYGGASFRNILLFGGSYLLVVVLALFGILRSLKAGPGKPERILLLGLAFFVGLHLIVPGMIRYRLPAEPFLILFAAQAVQHLWAFSRRQHDL